MRGLKKVRQRKKIKQIQQIRKVVAESTAAIAYNFGLYNLDTFGFYVGLMDCNYLGWQQDIETVITNIARDSGISPIDGDDWLGVLLGILDFLKIEHYEDMPYDTQLCYRVTVLDTGEKVLNLNGFKILFGKTRIGAYCFYHKV